ncbi:MAG TPA: recombinase family protein [Pseudonocardiaceae bacterium]
MKVEMYSNLRTAAGGSRAIGWQRDALRSAVEGEGAEVAAEFVDDGCSGMSLDRPGLVALRDAVDAGTIDALWCLSPDRLSRDYHALVTLLDELDRHRVPVRFLDAPALDSSQARGLAQLWAINDGARTRSSQLSPQHSRRIGPRGGDDGC